ncbi:penicillin-binding protein 1A [Zavarzinia compransoris]|uniref:Penicillin-binding protein 1A n=2 Tax=Zavarzinia compransoris TaxID=1264899 RepID=A0A317EBV5_9PROT|nr:penicillin-binding protein [Zavarzinia compransoris]TDP47961.1 penicillin-binding protein 1A [Zavarzinia compransoris]
MRFLGLIFGAFAMLAVVGLLGGLWVLHHFSQDLPDYRQLAVYEPPVTTRLQAGDGSLLAEYARERRLFVPITQIPPQVIGAFLSAEDKDFYRHGGIDFSGVLRAVFTNLRNMGSDRRPVGASTITQQVAKNFLLGNEVSYGRKIREAILTFRIERTFSKDRILELYLNEIYLGMGSYGVAAAALNYFGKSMDELTVAEVAYLAALPKAPSNYHPVRQREAATARRNWVLDRMYEDGRITRAQWEEAKATPLAVRDPGRGNVTRADYFAEEVRREIVSLYGEQSLYEGGLSVRTSIDPAMQALADRVLRAGMIDYDRRHGWRGPITRIAAQGGDWLAALKDVPAPAGLVVPGVSPWRLAVITGVDAKAATLVTAEGVKGQIAFADMAWARPTTPNQGVGAAPKKPGDVVAVGDVIAVEPAKDRDGVFALRQIPNVGAAFVALDPHTGRVLAMVGGWSYGESQFNRATQASRQPGSTFKPFVYATALESGLTPSTLVEDGPFVADQGPGMPPWRPANYGHDFLGAITLRVALEKSRNLVTARLAYYLGIDKVKALAERFGVVIDLPPYLAMSLGAGETTLLRMTAAYGQFVNGGKKIIPSLIDRIQDRRGRTVFKHDMRPCDGCTGIGFNGQQPPAIPDNRPEVIDAGTAYQMVSILQGVVERGTGGRVRAVGKPLAGKTGTSNDSKDVWFIGFSPDLVAGVFFGFDQPRTLGGKETGGSVAAPVFRDFMKEALANKPGLPFRIPPGLRLVRVNPASGAPAAPGERAIFEAFKPGTEPFGPRPVLDGTADASFIGSDGLSGDNDFLGAIGAPGPGGGPPAAAGDTATGGLY